MGMDLAPASGYILEVTERILPKLQLFLREYETLIGEFEVDGESAFESIVRLFNSYPPIEVEITIKDMTMTPVMMFYTNDDGGAHDDLSDGLYLLFEEEDLFIKELTYPGMILSDTGLFPKYKRWTVYE